jgi:hypothetical protein
MTSKHALELPMQYRGHIFYLTKKQRPKEKKKCLFFIIEKEVYCALLLQILVSNNGYANY